MPSGSQELATHLLWWCFDDVHDELHTVLPMDTINLVENHMLWALVLHDRTILHARLTQETHQHDRKDNKYNSCNAKEFGS